MEPTTFRSITPATLQLKRILVPVDFSGLSSQAIRYAARFAQRFGSTTDRVARTAPRPVFVVREKQHESF
jgi:nucleotide-binding universal stress UspA family protein